MMKLALRLSIATLVIVLATPASAVLCQKKSGALFVREACKKKETVVSGDVLGTGPQGPPGQSGTNPTIVGAVATNVAVGPGAADARAPIGFSGGFTPGVVAPVAMTVGDLHGL